MVGMTKGGVRLSVVLEGQSTAFPDTEEETTSAGEESSAYEAALGKKASETASRSDDAWEVCSEASDMSSWSTVSKCSDSSWLQVIGDQQTEADDEIQGKPWTYLAQLMKNPERQFEVRCVPSRRFATRQLTKNEAVVEFAEYEDTGQDVRVRCWQKKQKDSWSQKAQKKIDYQKAKRQSQRLQSRT